MAVLAPPIIQQTSFSLYIVQQTLISRDVDCILHAVFIFFFKIADHPKVVINCSKSNLSNNYYLYGPVLLIHCPCLSWPGSHYLVTSPSCVAIVVMASTCSDKTNKSRCGQASDSQYTVIVVLHNGL